MGDGALAGGRGLSVHDAIEEALTAAKMSSSDLERKMKAAHSSNDVTGVRSGDATPVGQFLTDYEAILPLASKVLQRAWDDEFGPRGPRGPVQELELKVDVRNPSAAEMTAHYETKFGTSLIREVTNVPMGLALGICAAKSSGSIVEFYYRVMPAGPKQSARWDVFHITA